MHLQSLPIDVKNSGQIPRHNGQEELTSRYQRKPSEETFPQEGIAELFQTDTSCFKMFKLSLAEMFSILTLLLTSEPKNVMHSKQGSGCECVNGEKCLQ